MVNIKHPTDTRKPYSGLSRSLVIAIDVGTTFSGVSYAILEPGEIPKIHGVTRFPGQEHVAGNSKIPSIVYYDKTGRVVAAGAEAEQAQTIARAEEEEWIKVELFKLRLRPRTMQLNMNGMRLGPLPRRKTPVHIFGDFLAYLYRCTHTFIIDTHAGGLALWGAVESNIQFVLSHPNGWEGAQQSKMRRAAVYGGLIPDTNEGKARIRFVTEGEASLHACVLNGLAADVLSNPSKHGFLIADAGGGTLDISAYAIKGTAPLVIEEIAPPDCIFAGSVFVSRRAREFLEEHLKSSKYGSPDAVTYITRRFDETTKRLFRDRRDPQFIPFGSPLDKDPNVGIRAGQLKLSGNEVANLFEPSVDAAVTAIKKQIEASHGVIKSVFLVGGYAASPWLFTQLQERLVPLRVSVSRPDTQTSKAVADGAIGFYCDHHVSARMSRCTYGVEFLRELDPRDPEHVARKEKLCELPSGPRLLPDAFDCILARNVKVKESTVFTRKYCTELTSLSMLSVFEVEIWCYRGGNEVPKWINRQADDFSTLCIVRADLSLLSGSAEPKMSRNGRTYWTIVFSVEIHFGLTEFRARIKWVDNGKTRYGPASIVYNERGHRADEDEPDSYPEDDFPPSASTATPRSDRDRLRSEPVSRARTPIIDARPHTPLSAASPRHPADPIITTSSASSSRRPSQSGYGLAGPGGVPEVSRMERTASRHSSTAPVSASASPRAGGYELDRRRSEKGKDRDRDRDRDSHSHRDRESYRDRDRELGRERSTPRGNSRIEETLTSVWDAPVVGGVATSPIGPSLTSASPVIRDPILAAAEPPRSAVVERSPWGQSVGLGTARSGGGESAGSMWDGQGQGHDAARSIGGSATPRSVSAGGILGGGMTPRSMGASLGGAATPRNGLVDVTRDGGWDAPAPVGEPAWGEARSFYEDAGESNKPPSLFGEEQMQNQSQFGEHKSPFGEHNSSFGEANRESLFDEPAKSPFGIAVAAGTPRSIFGDKSPELSRGITEEPPRSAVGDAPKSLWGSGGTESAKSKSKRLSTAASAISRASSTMGAGKSPFGKAAEFGGDADIVAAPAIVPPSPIAALGLLGGKSSSSPSKPPLSPLNPSTPALGSKVPWGTFPSSSGDAGDAWGVEPEVAASGFGDGAGGEQSVEETVQAKTPIATAAAIIPPEEVVAPIEEVKEVTTPGGKKKKKKGGASAATTPGKSPAAALEAAMKLEAEEKAAAEAAKIAAEAEAAAAAQAEEERKAKEVEERLAREEEERKVKEEEEMKAKEKEREEQEKQAKEEAEKKAKEEESKPKPAKKMTAKEKKEAEKKAKEQQEKEKKEQKEKERKEKEEEQKARIEREEKERLEKEENERKAKEEEERMKEEEEERKKKEEEERILKEKEDEDKTKKEEEERILKEKEDEHKKQAEEAERKAKEEQEAQKKEEEKAQNSSNFLSLDTGSNSLFSDLNSPSQPWTSNPTGNDDSWGFSSVSKKGSKASSPLVTTPATTIGWGAPKKASGFGWGSSLGTSTETVPSAVTTTGWGTGLAKSLSFDPPISPNPETTPGNPIQPEGISNDNIIKSPKPAEGGDLLSTVDLNGDGQKAPSKPASRAASPAPETQAPEGDSADVTSPTGENVEPTTPAAEQPAEEDWGFAVKAGKKKKKGAAANAAAAGAAADKVAEDAKKDDDVAKDGDEAKAADEVVKETAAAAAAGGGGAGGGGGASKKKKKKK